jgi:hypothetical protein
MPEDTLTFTLRLHDPAEKNDAEKSTNWAVVQIPRADLKLSQAEFIDKYVVPNLATLKLLTLQ